MKKLRTLTIMGLLIVILMGCNGNPKETVQENEPGVSYENWRETGFVLKNMSVAPGPVGEEEDIYHEAFFQEMENKKPDFAFTAEHIATKYLADSVYTFASYETEEGVKCLLTVAPIGEEAGQSVEVGLPEEIIGGYVLDIDVASAKKLSVLFAGSKEADKAPEDLYVFETDLQGNTENTRKLTEGYLQQEDEAACSLFMVDEQGYTFLVNSWENRMYVYNASGKLMLKRECEDVGETVRGGFHMPDGSVILLVSQVETMTTDFVWYDVSSMKPKVLQTLGEHFIENACIEKSGTIYYIASSRVFAWNITTGEQTKLFDCMFHNIESGQLDATTVVSENKIALYSTTFGKTAVYVFSDEEVQVEENDISMVFLASADNYLRLTAASYSRMHPDMPVTIAGSTEEKQAYHDRVMADLVSGKGPDLLWVDVEDMQILYEKGAIQPLDDLVSEQTREQIFPGIMASGSIDGKLMGVYFDSMPHTFLVNKELLGKDNWEQADLNAVASKNPQMQGLMTSTFNYSEGILLRFLALNDLENCPYIDWNSNKSNFNCEEFIELLKYLKQYGGSKSEKLEQVCEGDYLSYMLYIEMKDLVGYSQVMAQCEDSCLLLGYPGSNQSTGWWLDGSFLVVNAASDKKEEIGEFIEYAFSPAAQKECTLGSVRRDAISSQVYVHEYFGYYAYGPGAVELEVKENGETYLEDYLLFLDNCAPLPRSYEAIESIVLDEAELFFDGTYTAEQAVERIDNRVQLYLDEQ